MDIYIPMFLRLFSFMVRAILRRYRKQRIPIFSASRLSRVLPSYSSVTLVCAYERSEVSSKKWSVVAWQSVFFIDEEDRLWEQCEESWMSSSWELGCKTKWNIVGRSYDWDDETLIREIAGDWLVESCSLIDLVSKTASEFSRVSHSIRLFIIFVTFRASRCRNFKRNLS